MPAHSSSLCYAKLEKGPAPIQVAHCDSHRHRRTVEGTRIQRRDVGGNIPGGVAAGIETCGAATTRKPIGASRKARGWFRDPLIWLRAWFQNPTAAAARNAASIRNILAGKRMGSQGVGADSGHTSARSPDGGLAWRRRLAFLVAAEPSTSPLKKVACTLAACEAARSDVAEEADAAPSIEKV